MRNARTNSKRLSTLIAAVTVAAATMAVTPPAHAKPLLASTTTVDGASFYGFQPGRTEMQVNLVAEVSVPVLSPLGRITHATVTFEVGSPGRAPFTLTAPLVGPCPAHCFASVDFYRPPNCSATDPGFWVRATFSGETVGPPVNRAISGPSTSEAFHMSSCPDYTN